MKTTFSYGMNYDPFDRQIISRELIKKALDYVFEEYLLGNFNFFTLSNNETNYFIQAVFEGGQWEIEYAENNGYILKKNLSKYEEIYHYFFAFLEGEPLDLTTFTKVAIADL